LKRFSGRGQCKKRVKAEGGGFQRGKEHSPRGKDDAGLKKGEKEGNAGLSWGKKRTRAITGTKKLVKIGLEKGTGNGKRKSRKRRQGEGNRQGEKKKMVKREKKKRGEKTVLSTSSGLRPKPGKKKLSLGKDAQGKKKKNWEQGQDCDVSPGRKNL